MTKLQIVLKQKEILRREKAFFIILKSSQLQNYLGTSTQNKVNSNVLNLIFHK